MNIVADTNIFLAVSLNEEERERIIRLTKNTKITAPEILPYEIGHVLSAMVKRRQLKKAEAIKAENITNLISVRLVSVDIHASLKLP